MLAGDKIFMLVDSQRLAIRSDRAPARPRTAPLRAQQEVHRGCIAGRNRTRQLGSLASSGGGSDIYSWRYCGHDEVLFSGRVYVRRRDGNFIDLGGDVPMGGSNALSALYLLGRNRGFLSWEKSLAVRSDSTSANCSHR